MPLIARQRSRLAVLAVLALVGSLLAVSAVPAVAAEDDTADEKAMYSACVGAATDDAGFTDMDSSFAADEANCLAHYGITLGTGNGMFSPDMAVTRLQMARFLSRAAGPAGIDTMGVEAQGLTDISDMSEEAQDAVNTVAHLGIMTARSDDTFDPAGIVSRRDMAVHLAAFLSAALTGPGGNDIDDLKDDRASGKSPFTDISGVSVSAHKAIRDVFELGVTTGKTDTTFAPNDPVSREQMAAFITRALGHTNARPIGISAQGPAMAFVDAADGAGGDADISVSVRDSDHQPVPDASIGVISTETPDEAFDDAGECVTAKVTSSGAGCKITTSDEATDPDGNAEVSVDLGNTAGTTTAWVWTGDTGDEFDADTTENAKVETDRVLEATGLKVTVDTKKNAKFLKFGDTVTYTLQAVDANGDPVAHKDASVNVTATIADITSTLDADGDRTDDEALRDDSETTEAVHKTDAAGRIQIDFTADDPKSGNDNRGDRIELSIVLADSSLGTPDVSGANDQNDTDDGIQIIWSDAASDPAGGTLSLSSAVGYHEVDSAGGAVGNALMATLVDQYGDPVRGQKISVWSTVTNTADATLGLGGRTLDTAGSDTNPADNRTTNRNGVATKRYTRSGTTAAAETLDASLKMVNGNCRNTDAGCPDADEADTDVIAATDVEDHTHYWAVRATANVTANDVLVADKDNNSIVLGPEGTPTLVTYKSGDYFQIGDDSATMAAFEKALNDGSGTADADQVTVTINTASGINTFNISTNN